MLMIFLSLLIKYFQMLFATKLAVQNDTQETMRMDPGDRNIIYV